MSSLIKGNDFTRSDVFSTSLTENKNISIEFDTEIPNRQVIDNIFKIFTCGVDYSNLTTDERKTFVEIHLVISKENAIEIERSTV